ncbi:hypothetical protein SDC9_138944 [bioreactor metagenome]|uniref:Uncharacterized protein n=1 Tax=bioreactor metagenome TaxID=1076179 RepID=A0A645DQQ5_9ZZZZ
MLETAMKPRDISNDTRKGDDETKNGWTSTRRSSGFLDLRRGDGGSSAKWTGGIKKLEMGSG